MTKAFFTQIGRLDEILGGGPGRCNYERDLAPLLSEPVLNEYFFTRVSDPAWLPMLVGAKKFATLPSLAVNETEKTVGFPAWPQAEYLKRIVEIAPGEVSEILAHLPSTDNARIHDAIMQVALSIHGRFAERLVPKVLEGIRAPYHLNLPLKISPLISLFATAGNAAAAFQLAEAALEILPASKAVARSVSDTQEPATRFDLWTYEQVLLGSLPDLVGLDGKRALTLFCGLLDRAILISDAARAERRPHDLSHIWRPAIEEHQQNLKIGVLDALVSAVRDAGNRYVGGNRGVLSDVVAQLEEWGRSWWVFRRVVLHLLREFSADGFALVRERLLDRALFDSVEVRHEYYLLEKECFRNLSTDEQTVLVGWIQDGPQYSDNQLKKWEEFTGRPWTEKDKASYVRQWKRDHFAPLEGQLNAKWKKEYAELLLEVGPPSHPEFTTYHEGGAWGPTSPEGRDELGKRTAAALVAYLEDWKPKGDWPLNASPEGLGRELTALVAEQPERYATACPEFTQLSEPTYVRAVVEGFQNALAAKRRFNWDPVLDFCVWAVRHEREIPGRNIHHFGMDAHWGWTKAAVSRLLTGGFSSEENPIPFELREKVWHGTSVGTGDPEPTPEQEKEYFEKFAGGEQKTGGVARASAFDPFTNSLNTPRGVAIESVIRYALWVRNGFEKSKDSKSLAKGFEAMPEVREVLDLHLNPENDPSVTIRTVYGQRAPWLQLLDEEWAQSNTARIFARSSPELWHAAWDAYIGYSQPFDKVFDWLQGEYAYAIRQMGSHDHGWSQPLAPDYSLAQHLISFYWRGKFSTESEILAAFFARAGGPLRAHVLSYIGRSLRNTTDSVPMEITERLKILWTQLVAAAQRHPERSNDEFKEYGWWFASSKLDDQWSVDQLLEALRLAKRVEPDHLVVERLVTLATSMPGPSVEALRMMIDGDSKGWGVLGWADKAKEIIRAARKSGNARARETAEYLVNLLGSRGHFDFGELLKEPT